VKFRSHVNWRSISLFGFVTWFEFLAKSEITEFDLAVVEKNVAWFEISMNNTTIPNVFESIQKLL